MKSSKIKEYVGATRYTDGNFALATQLLQDMVFEENFEDFLTLRAYKYI
jgi:malate synthase